MESDCPQSNLIWSREPCATYVCRLGHPIVQQFKRLKGPPRWERITPSSAECVVSASCQVPICKKKKKNLNTLQVLFGWCTSFRTEQRSVSSWVELQQKERTHRGEETQKVRHWKGFSLETLEVLICWRNNTDLPLVYGVYISYCVCSEHDIRMSLTDMLY